MAEVIRVEGTDAKRGEEKHENVESDDKWRELEYEDVLDAIEMGDKSAKTKLAWLKLSGFGDADFDEKGAVALLEERVNEGDADAMWMLGVCNEYGIGIKQNLVRAESLYKESSKKRNKIGDYFASHGGFVRGSGRVCMNGL